MHRAAARTLLDLLATAEPFSDDDCVGRRIAYRRQQDPLADRHCNIMGLASKSECACHPATALRRPFDIDGELLKKLQLGLEAEHRVMVAMRLHQRSAALLRAWKALEVPDHEIVELDDLPGEAFRFLAIGEEAGELVAER